jgi:hypothetical protein
MRFAFIGAEKARHSVPMLCACWACRRPTRSARAQRPLN